MSGLAETWANERESIRAAVVALNRGGHFGAAKALEDAFERIDNAFLQEATGGAS